MSSLKEYGTVAWREVSRIGDFVFMKRGTGQTGYWHEHDDGSYAGNPCDYNRQSNKYVCRSCGKVFNINVKTDCLSVS